MDERVDATVCYRHPDRPTRLACTECGRPICVECSIDAAVGQKCPECAKPVGRARVVDARRTTGPRAGLNGAPVTKWIMYTTFAVFLIGLISQDARDWLGAGGVIGNLEQVNFLLAEGELWRLLTHAWLHSYGLIFHVALNMYGLYLFGPELERRVGGLPFLLFYLAAAAWGGAFEFFFAESFVRSLGASGAIFGLFGAWTYVSWRMRHTAAGQAQFRTLAVLVAINLAFPFLATNLRIAWQAHVGGLIGGAAIAWAWGMFAARRENAVQRRSIIAAVALVLAFAAVVIGRPAVAEATTDCLVLIEQVKDGDTLTPGAKADIIDEASRRIEVALARGDLDEAGLCLWALSIDDPGAVQAIKTNSIRALIDAAR